MTNRKSLKRKFEAIESMAAHLRSTLDEAERQSKEGQFSNAFYLLRNAWPSVVYVAHRRFTGTPKAHLRPSTTLINGLCVNGMPANVQEMIREADIVAVMRGTSPEHVNQLIEASRALLDATETAFAIRPKQSARATMAKPNGRLTRWASAAAGLFSVAN